jgi:hypothetical protein
MTRLHVGDVVAAAAFRATQATLRCVRVGRA